MAVERGVELSEDERRLLTVVRKLPPHAIASIIAAAIQRHQQRCQPSQPHAEPAAKATSCPPPEVPGKS